MQTTATIQCHLPRDLANMVMTYITPRNNSLKRIIEAGCVELLDTRMVDELPCSTAELQCRYDWAGTIDRVAASHNGKYYLRYCLYGACRAGNDAMADRLFSLGAACGSITFNRACYSGNVSLAKKIRSRCPDWWQEVSLNGGLHFACRGGHDEMIRWLIQLGADNWHLALHGAIRKGRTRLVLDIINRGAKISMRHIESATKHGHHDLAELLTRLWQQAT